MREKKERTADTPKSDKQAKKEQVVPSLPPTEKNNHGGSAKGARAM